MTPAPAMTLRLAARLLLLQARWDPARMQGAGLAFALEPWLAACWAAEPEALAAARARHNDYFNTHPIAAWLLTGVIARLEGEAAAAEGGKRAALVVKIKTLKTGLGASLAGLYDSFFWGALRPASAVAGILVAQACYRGGIAHPALAGALTALVVYNGPGFAARWLGLTRGLNLGETAVAELCVLPAQPWIGGLRRAAAGGALASFALSAWWLGAPERLGAVLAFSAGLLLTWRGVAPLTQLGLAGLAGMAVSATGLLS